MLDPELKQRAFTALQKAFGVTVTDIVTYLTTLIAKAVLESQKLAEHISTAIEERISALPAPVAVPDMTDEEQREATKQLVSEIVSTTLAGQQEIIDEAVAKATKATALTIDKEADARELADKVGNLLLGDRSFLIALSEAQKKGKEASIDSKKKTIKEIVGEFRDITPESVSDELVEELFHMGVVRGRSENWVTAIQTALIEKHVRMSETITSLIRKNDLPKATEHIGKYAWFLVDSSCATTIEAIRTALEVADNDDQLLIPYFKKR